eukprot:1515848-Pyramimonas_sp.AAC.1
MPGPRKLRDRMIETAPIYTDRTAETSRSGGGACHATFASKSLGRTWGPVARARGAPPCKTGAQSRGPTDQLRQRRRSYLDRSARL